MTHVTISSESETIYDNINNSIVSIDNMSSSKDLDSKVKVFVNGTWVGITDSPEEFYKNLKEKKYKCILNIYTSIVFNLSLFPSSE